MKIRRQEWKDFLRNSVALATYQWRRKLNKLHDKSPVRKAGWKLIMEDNFTKVSWGRVLGAKWDSIGNNGYHIDKDLVYYGYPETVTIDGKSYADFSVKFEPKMFEINGLPKSFPFKVSYLTTKFSQRFKYGRFECRCTIPFEKYTWPAFWLWGAPWPPEVDIFEMYGGENGETGTQAINLHYGNVKEGSKTNMRPWKIKLQDRPKRGTPPVFHEFAFEWYEDKMVFYTNGVEVFRYTDKEVLDKWYNSAENMWLVLNHSIDAAYYDNISSNYTSNFLVDYVRVYKLKE